MGEATIEYGLQAYGARMTLEQVCDELKIGERKWRNGVAAGEYPAPVDRGRWATEAIMTFATSRKEEVHDEDDPFDLSGSAPESQTA